MSYEQIGAEVGRETDKKNNAYGGIHRVAEVMRVLYPDGIPVDKFDDALLVVRVLDKLNRISGGEKSSFGEDPWRDIAGYGLLGMGEKSNVEKGCHSCADGVKGCPFPWPKIRRCKDNNYLLWQPRKEGTR